MKFSAEGSACYAYSAARAHDPEVDTVVFVHGAAMDHSVWTLQSRYFAYHGFNVLALDLPGHGQSEGEPRNRIGDYAIWLKTALGESTGRRLHLVGHSMGSLICLETASRMADTERAPATLSLVGFTWPMAVTPILLDAARDDPREAYAMMTQWSHASPVGGEPNPGFWAPGGQFRLLENSHPGAVFADLTACNDYDGGADAMARVTCPIRFISGARDRMAPSPLARKMAAEKPGAEIVILPDCGHNLMAESPDGVRDALFEFIRAA